VRQEHQHFWLRHPEHFGNAACFGGDGLAIRAASIIPTRFVLGIGRGGHARCKQHNDQRAIQMSIHGRPFNCGGELLPNVPAQQRVGRWSNTPRIAYPPPPFPAAPGSACLRCRATTPARSSNDITVPVVATWYGKSWRCVAGAPCFAPASPSLRLAVAFGEHVSNPSRPGYEPLPNP